MIGVGHLYYGKEGKANIIIVVCVVVIFLGLGYYLLSKDPGGPARIVEVTHSPQNPQPGETITLTAEVEGVSGPTAYVYNSYFGTSTPSGSGTFFGSMGGGEYSTQLYVFPENGKEVSCFVIAWDGAGNPALSDEHVIQIGYVERSDITSLEISNVSHGTPPNPGTSTTVDAYADIQTDAPPIDAKVISFYYGKNGTCSICEGSEMSLQTENTYRGEIAPFIMDENWPSNPVTVMYKVVAKDNMGNTTVSEWADFDIS